MRASATGQTGTGGVSAVMADFEGIGWGPVENTRHDLGTDLYVQARDQRLWDLGLIVGAQVKSGASWFGEPEVDDSGSVVGWWFRDKDREHFDSWLSHAVPHLLILRDLESGTSFWAHVTDDVVISTGKGAKILVPKTNVVEAAQLDALLAVARSGRPGATWEGSVWGAGKEILPRDLLRHALVVPRLVAPHPNAGQRALLTPAQGIALLMQGRFQDYGEFADRYPSVPQWHEASADQEWPWRFVGALAARIIQGDASQLLQRVGDASGPAERTSATVAAVCALVELDQQAEALSLLNDALSLDDASPVDDAWLRGQRARVRAEIGQVAEARADAVSIPAVGVGAPKDATASAIASAATALLVSTAGWAQLDIEALIAGSDTAARWWRAQNTSRGLGAIVERTFKAWADDQAVTVYAEDPAETELRGAALAASHIGDQGEWRYLATLTAKDALLRLGPTSDPAVVASALDELRRAGGQDSVKVAVQRLVQNGPASAVRAVAAAIDLSASTRTTGHTNLRLLQLAGDILDTETADAVAAWLNETLLSSDAFVRKTTPGYLVTEVLAKTWAAVLPAAGPEAHRVAIERLIDLPAVQDDQAASALGDVARSIPDAAWTPDQAVRARDSAAAHHDHFKLALLRKASVHDEAAKGALMDRAKSGSVDALVVLGSLKDLPTDVVKPVLDQTAVSALSAVEDARASKWGIGADVAGNLAVLNAWHPEIARWDPVLDVLAEGKVGTWLKRSALMKLATLVDYIPEDVAVSLRPIVVGIAKGEIGSFTDPFFNPGNARGEATHLAIGLGAFADAELDLLVTKLVHGSAIDRRWAAVSARRRGRAADVGLLVGLSADPVPDVRAAAAAGLADVVAQGAGGTTAQVALDRCLADPGTSVPRAIAMALRGRVGAEVEATRAALSTHISAGVRSLT